MRVLDRRIGAVGDLVVFAAMKAVVEHGGEVLRHAAHAARADRLDAGLLDRLEHRARLLAAGHEFAMHGRVVAGEPQRDRIGVAAHDGRLALIEPARRLRQPRLAAGQPGALGGEGDLEIALAGDRAQADADRALERLGRRVLGGAFGLDVGGHSALLRSPPRAGSRRFVSDQRHVDRGFRQFLPEAALIEFRHQRPLQLVAFVDEGEPEGEADVAEDFGILRPGDHRARAHDGGDVAVHEGVAGEVGDPHHLRDDVAAFGRAVVLGLGEHDLDLVVVRQIVQRGDDRPAVHLALVDLLGAVIEAGRVAEADRVGGREQAERRMRLDHLVLVEQRQPAGRFQHALDHEHHVGAAGVVFVEAQRDIVLQRPRQNAVAEFGDLHAVADHDRILADEIDAADMAVEIDAHARPVEPRRHLLDMGRLAGAVIAGDDDPAVPGKAGEDGERGRLVEPVVGIEVRHVLVRLGIGRHFQVAVDAEQLPDRDLHIRQAGFRFGCESHCTSVTPELSEALNRPSPAVGCRAKLAEAPERPRKPL